MLTVSIAALAVACGLMAGVYFTFSSVVMGSLGAISAPSGISAMQSINRLILSSAFMPIFFGTTLASLGAVAWGLTHQGTPGSPFLIVGGIVYVLGMFLCTAVGNVPLNEALDAVEPETPQAAMVWAEYLRDWTRWNHLRTICSAASSALYVAAVLA